MVCEGPAPARSRQQQTLLLQLVGPSVHELLAMHAAEERKPEANAERCTLHNLQTIWGTAHHNRRCCCCCWSHCNWDNNILPSWYICWTRGWG